MAQAEVVMTSYNIELSTVYEKNITEGQIVMDCIIKCMCEASSQWTDSEMA